VGKPEGKKTYVCKDDTILGLQEIVLCGCVYQIYQAEDRDRWQAIVNTVMNVQVI
jgi:hypothetical protein